VQEGVTGEIDIKQRELTVFCTRLEFQIRQDLENKGYLENGTTRKRLLWLPFWFGWWFMQNMGIRCNALLLLKW